MTLLSGCDVCETGPPVKQPEGDIYFSALPVNSIRPSIFRINSDGKNLKEIIKNGYLYSPPSSDKKLVFLQENTEGRNVVILSDIEGNNRREIGDMTWSGARSYPIISPDGSKVSVCVGARELWIIFNETNYSKITNKLCSNTLPVFSPDGSKIAFYEGYDLFVQFTFKVFDLKTTPPSLISQKICANGLLNWFGESTIDWTFDINSVTFSESPNLLADSVHITNGESQGSVKSYEVPGFGAYQPVLSSDKQKIAFAGRDGNIWIRDLIDNSNKYLNITGSNSKQAYNIYPQWSDNGESIIYSKYFKDDAVTTHATLEIADLTVDPPKIRILSNNVYRGFWNRYK